MNHPDLLSPTLLHAAAFVVVASGAMMIAAHTAILSFATRRTSVSRRAQIGVPLLTAGLLAGWFAWSVLAVGDWVTAPEPPPLPGGVVQRPDLLLDMAAAVVLGIVVMFISRAAKEINAATPPAWLIGVQSYRIAGVMFLWPFLASGALPAGFALPAGIGDMLTGIAAPFVALAVAQSRPGARARAVAWNWFGILDLVVATIAAVLTHTTNVGRFPLVVVPLFLGPPLGILTHIWSLRNLRAARMAEAAPVSRELPRETVAIA
ncbi:MAG TPA: hypothetical protein VG710_14295 [Opitutus sp.]|nr:hypothetical protein [Opitutus sp.]